MQQRPECGSRWTAVPRHERSNPAWPLSSRGASVAFGGRRLKEKKKVQRAALVHVSLRPSERSLTDLLTWEKLAEAECCLDNAVAHKYLSRAVAYSHTRLLTRFHFLLTRYHVRVKRMCLAIPALRYDRGGIFLHFYEGSALLEGELWCGQFVKICSATRCSAHLPCILLGRGSARLAKLKSSHRRGMLRSAQRASYASPSRFYYRCETSARVGNPVSRPRAGCEGRAVLHDR